MKYRELYPNSLTEGLGLISQMAAYDVPWAALDDFNLRALERSYCLHSGFKEVIPTFSEMNVEDRIPAILIHYLHKWTRYYNLYMTEYNPLSAYRVVESGENTRTPNLQDQTTKGTMVTVSGTDSGTVTTSDEFTERDSTFKYGFNSINTPVPVEDGSSGGGTTVTETRALDDSSTTTNSGSDTVKRTGTEKTVHEITKEGNIGYSTPQKLMREELALWMKPYFDIVFSDIDNFIMINVF